MVCRELSGLEVKATVCVLTRSMAPLGGHAGGRAWRTARQSRAQSGHVGTRRRGMMGHRPMEPSAQPNMKENTKAGIRRSKRCQHTAVSQ